MRKYGKVVIYDGYVGTIVDKEGTRYIFRTRDLVDRKTFEGDFVSFNYEVFETVEMKEYVAKNVEKVSQEEMKPTE